MYGLAIRILPVRLEKSCSVIKFISLNLTTFPYSHINNIFQELHITFRNLLWFLSPISILSETFAKEYSFILKEDVKNELSFVLELPEGDVIYSNIRDNSNHFPATFKIFSHKNLKNYHLKLPESKTKYQDGIGDVLSISMRKQ